MVKLYSKIRLVTSPILWRLLYYRKRKNEITSLTWEYTIFLTSEIKEASRKLNEMPYRSDLLRGFIDVSVPLKYAYYFFAPIKYGRDCDDFARLWTAYGIKNGYEAKEYIIKEKRKTKAHMFTLLIGEETYLCDYTPSKVKNLPDAIGIIAKKYGYKKYEVVEYNYKKELF